MNDQQTIAAAYESRLRSEIRVLDSAALSTRILALGLLLGSLLVAYGTRITGSGPFFTVPLVFVLQVMNMLLLRQAARLRSQLPGVTLPGSVPEKQMGLLSAFCLSVYKGFFVVFFCFDLTWLFSSYANPVPAVSYAQYLDRLGLAPVSGAGFIVFTEYFWAVYLLAFVAGWALSRSDAGRAWLSPGRADLPVAPSGPRRVRFGVPVTDYNGRSLTLRGFRMPNPGCQPLILWHGFFQNGAVYDLQPDGGSLAEYLWSNGYDLWIMHARGASGSDGAFRKGSLDDFAAADIPAVIDFVAGHTARKPVYVGHSQGGITAIISMMGAVKDAAGIVHLSDVAAAQRQEALKGLVTLGSYLDFDYVNPSAVKDFVQHGLRINLFGKKVRLVKSQTVLKLVGILPYIPFPVPIGLRQALVRDRLLRFILFPLTLILNLAARLKLWQFLFNLPNLTADPIRRMLYLTHEGTYYGIIRQFYGALMISAMSSADQGVNYSANYGRLTLPVHFVAMGLDPIADAVKMRDVMFAAVSSPDKQYTLWEGQGHEDFFMNPAYFHQLLDAIRRLEHQPVT